MDLDQLIRDADPAQHLDSNPPDSRLITERSIRSRRLVGRLGFAVSLAVVVAVVVVLGATGQRASQRPGAPRDLPLGASWSQAGPSGVLASTVRLGHTYRDPEGTPVWGLRTYKTKSGMTCLQVGRLESDRVGAIGADRRFHPFTLSDLGLGTCAPDDAHGHAFINEAYREVPATAASEPCQRRNRCAIAAQRQVYFGLLGPDTTSITYATPGGRQQTERTQGPDGAFLVILPAVRQSCDRSRSHRPPAPSMCVAASQGGEQIGATVDSGEITAITYRDGHACHLPAPSGPWVGFAQCPVVGYAAPPGPKYTQTEIAAPVHIRKLAARHYCARRGPSRPGDLWIPCDGPTPAGYMRIKTGQSLLVYVSWTARAPVSNVNDSTYSISITYPHNCGGEGTSTQAVIHAREQVTRSLTVSEHCAGTATGRVIYIPNLGPGGQEAASVHAGSGGLLVGRFSFTLG